MRTLSNVFKWVGGIILAAGLICGGVFANDAKSGAGLIFLYWSIGGGLACMFLCAYGYFLEVAADIKDRLDADAEKANLSQQKTEQQFPQKSAAVNTTVAKAVSHNGLVVCPQCGHEQKDNAVACAKCGAYLQAKSASRVNPSQSSAHAGSGFKVPDVDYIVCEKCGYEQRNNRTVCYNCGAPLSNSGESTNGKGNL